MIKYTETIKMDFEIETPDEASAQGIDISGLMPESMTQSKELYFTDSEFSFIDAKNNESQDQEMESDDGSVKIVIQMNEDDEIFYTNLSSANTIHQTSFMGKQFLIEQELAVPKWKLTGEKINYLGYECHKAELFIPKSGKDKDKHIVAWFAPSIPFQVGPQNYHSLPGAILMLSENVDKVTYQATEINMDIDVSEKIKKPKKGKSVSPLEFEKIIEEKEKELKQLSGGNSIIIRN